jgi:hypothetical protein
MINLRRMCNVSSWMDLPIRSAQAEARVFSLAVEIESDALVDQLRGLLCTPEIIVRTWRAAHPRAVVFIRVGTARSITRKPYQLSRMIRTRFVRCCG